LDWQGRCWARWLPFSPLVVERIRARNEERARQQRRAAYERNLASLNQKLEEKSRQQATAAEAAERRFREEHIASLVAELRTASARVVTEAKRAVEAVAEGEGVPAAFDESVREFGFSDKGHGAMTYSRSQELFGVFKKMIEVAERLREDLLAVRRSSRLLPIEQQAAFLRAATDKLRPLANELSEARTEFRSVLRAILEAVVRVAAAGVGRSA
jgi:hypothetical protein